MKKINKSKVFIWLIYSLIACKLLDAQTTINPAKVKIVPRKLYVPPLVELQAIFRAELLKNFAEVRVDIVDCPDLTKPPFNLAASGLGGLPAISEVGGLSHYSVKFQKQPLYDLKAIVKSLNYTTETLVLGAGTGPWPYLKKDSDIAVNIVLNKPKAIARSYGITLDEVRGHIVCQLLPPSETRFAVQANLFLSQGKPGKVLKVFVRKRKGEDSFIASMRRSIENHYGKKQLVGIGGAFTVLKGSVTEIFANILEKPIPKGSTLKRVRYFYVDVGSAPETGVGTFVSAKTDLDLTANHFHMFSLHGNCGHYVTDVSPTTVEYEGYFTPGKFLYRVDQAPPTNLVLNTTDHF